MDQSKLYGAPPAEGEEEEPGMAEIVETSILTLGALSSGDMAATQGCRHRASLRFLLCKSSISETLRFPFGKHCCCEASRDVPFETGNPHTAVTKTMDEGLVTSCARQHLWEDVEDLHTACSIPICLSSEGSELHCLNT